MEFDSLSQWARHVKKHRAYYVFILPAVFGVFFFKLGPMAASLVFSLTKYDVLTPPRFVGLGNFVKLFEDPLFLQVLSNTFYYVFVGLPLRLTVALAAAILLNQKIKGIGIFRTIYYLPSVTAGVAVSLLWRLIYNPRFGLANTLLQSIGIEGPAWLGDPAWAMPSIIIMMGFNIGQFMLIFLGGLQNIPDQLYEAVDLDGGGLRHKFWHVTIPHLTPVIFFNVIIGVINMMQMFTQVYVMTEGSGGPLDSTLVYVMYIYQIAFQNLKMGYGSALAWILFLILFTMTFAQFRFSGRWVYYRSGAEGRSRTAANVKSAKAGRQA